MDQQSSWFHSPPTKIAMVVLHPWIHALHAPHKTFFQMESLNSPIYFINFISFCTSFLYFIHLHSPWLSPPAMGPYTREPMAFAPKSRPGLPHLFPLIGVLGVGATITQGRWGRVVPWKAWWCFVIAIVIETIIAIVQFFVTTIMIHSWNNNGWKWRSIRALPSIHWFQRDTVRVVATCCYHIRNRCLEHPKTKQFRDATAIP